MGSSQPCLWELHTQQISVTKHSGTLPSAGFLQKEHRCLSRALNISKIFFFSSKHSLYVNQYPQPILGNRTHHPLTGRRDKVIRERKVTEQVTGSDRHDLHGLFIRSLHTGGCKLTLTPLTSIPLRQCWDSQHGLFSLSLSPAQPSHNDPTPSISAPFWGV